MILYGCLAMVSLRFMVEKLVGTRMVLSTVGLHCRVISV